MFFCIFLKIPRESLRFPRGWIWDQLIKHWLLRHWQLHFEKLADCLISLWCPHCNALKWKGSRLCFRNWALQKGGSRPLRKVGLVVYSRIVRFLEFKVGLDFHFDLQKETFIPMFGLLLVCPPMGLPGLPGVPGLHGLLGHQGLLGLLGLLGLPNQESIGGPGYYFLWN